MYQWTKENSEINLCIYGQSIYTKDAKIYNGEKIASSISCAGKTGQLHVKEWIGTSHNIIYKNKLKMN